MKETEPCEESACAGRVKSLRRTGAGAGDPTAAAAQMGYSFSLTASQRSHTCRHATYMHLDPHSLSLQRHCCRASCNTCWRFCYLSYHQSEESLASTLRKKEVNDVLLQVLACTFLPSLNVQEVQDISPAGTLSH
ncbi:hypothetical protein SRHO_G00261870 [Serrasalmus rhombeus]